LITVEGLSGKQYGILDRSRITSIVKLLGKYSSITTTTTTTNTTTNTTTTG
jgi:hypothetical protein